MRALGEGVLASGIEGELGEAYDEGEEGETRESDGDREFLSGNQGEAREGDPGE